MKNKRTAASVVKLDKTSVQQLELFDSLSKMHNLRRGKGKKNRFDTKLSKPLFAATICLFQRCNVVNVSFIFLKVDRDKVLQVFSSSAGTFFISCLLADLRKASGGFAVVILILVTLHLSPSR